MFDVSDEAEVSKRQLDLNRAKVMNGVLPFAIPPDSDKLTPYTLIGIPQVPFKPLALMLWGYDQDTLINHIRIGIMTQGDVSGAGGIPAEFFGTARTYEKLVEQFESNGIAPPAWITFKTTHVGEKVLIEVQGKLKHAIMLGKAVW